MKEMTPEKAAAVNKLMAPMFKVAYKMSPDELLLAMEGFHAADRHNCAWYIYALRQIMPPILGTIGGTALDNHCSPKRNENDDNR